MLIPCSQAVAINIWAYGALGPPPQPSPLDAVVMYNVPTTTLCQIVLYTCTIDATDNLQQTQTDSSS